MLEALEKRVQHMYVLVSVRHMVQTHLHRFVTVCNRVFSVICCQLELLLKYYVEDVRKAVKLSVLTDMRHLAKRAPHMWTSELILVRHHCYYYYLHVVFAFQY